MSVWAGTAKRKYLVLLAIRIRVLTYVTCNNINPVNKKGMSHIPYRVDLKQVMESDKSPIKD